MTAARSPGKADHGQDEIQILTGIRRFRDLFGLFPAQLGIPRPQSLTLTTSTNLFEKLVQRGYAYVLPVHYCWILFSWRGTHV
jgi:hypothetical protein